jgi:hypothetical protein
MIEAGRRYFSHNCYMEVITIVTWSIWIEQLHYFNGDHTSFVRWKKESKELFLLCKLRAKPTLEFDMMHDYHPCKYYFAAQSFFILIKVQ